MFLVGDPVAAGFASSLAKPGGNGTGVSVVSPELEAKRLQLLHQLAPRAQRIGYLHNPLNPLANRMGVDVEGAARTLGLHIELFNASRSWRGVVYLPARKPTF